MDCRNSIGIVIIFHRAAVAAPRCSGAPVNHYTSHWRDKPEAILSTEMKGIINHSEIAGGETH